MTVLKLRVASEIVAKHLLQMGISPPREGLSKNRYVLGLANLYRAQGKEPPYRNPVAARTYIQKLGGSLCGDPPGVVPPLPSTKPRRPKSIKDPLPFEATDAFLASWDWKRLRYDAIKLHGRKCQCCGASPDTGAALNVDHIKPRRLFPNLALRLDNLQVLCEDCNMGKGSRDQTDWRPQQ